jgi:sec-independent protein translocase protein TatA
MMYFAFGMPGPFELGVILVIVLIFVGVGKLPKVLGQMGKGVRAFKDGMQGGEEEIDITPDDDPHRVIESSILEEAREVQSVPVSEGQD